MCLWNPNATAMAIFLKLWPWYSTLTDDLELGTNKKVLSQSILMWNMKALTLTNQKILANVEVFVDKQTDKPTTIWLNPS